MICAECRDKCPACRTEPCRKCVRFGWKACGSCGAGFAAMAPRQRFCSEPCRQHASNVASNSMPFTEEMTAELYADAKAGRIEAWQ